MHTFQPYPVDLIEFDPFTKIGTEWMAVTVSDGEKTNTMTASWGTVGVLWNKNVACVFIRDSRYTKELLDKQDTFSLNWFEQEHQTRSALKYFGAVSGRDEDKISNVKMHVNHAADGTAFIDESNLVFICKKLSATRMTTDQFVDPSIADAFYKDGDMHTMYIAEVTQILAR